MACMSFRSTDFRESIEHLPAGATLVIHGLHWDDYEEILGDISHRPRLRVSYDCGKLEVMSPPQEHEMIARLIDAMVRIYAEELDLNVDSYGSTTWKRESVGRGVEPDACYYVENAALVIGKRQFDLEFDPPPDIVVEIDITSESLSRFSIYAALGVPEIWRYDGSTFQFYELKENKFTESAGSRFLSGLSGLLMCETIESTKSLRQTAALKVFRNRIRASKSK